MVHDADILAHELLYDRHVAIAYGQQQQRRFVEVHILDELAQRRVRHERIRIIEDRIGQSAKDEMWCWPVGTVLEQESRQGTV